MLPRGRLGPHHLHPLAAWLVLRILTSASAAYAVNYADVGPTVPVPGYSPPAFGGLGSLLAAPWLRADALWYLKISRDGYSALDGSLAFFPAYPSLVAVLRALFGGNEVVGALFLSSVATLAGMYVMFRLAEVLSSRAMAVVGVWTVALLPTSFFLMAPYAESLFLLLSAWALYACVRGKAIQSGIAGLLAGLTRPFGFALAIALLLVGWRKSSPRAALGAAFAPLLGLAIWIAFAAKISGDPIGGLAVQARWQREPSFFLITLVNGVKSWLQYRGSELGPDFLLDLAFVAFGLAAVALAFKVVDGRWAAWGVVGYGAAVLFIPLSSAFGPRPLLSMPRFILGLAPLFFGIGLLGRPIRVCMAALGASGLVALTTAFVAARPIF